MSDPRAAAVSRGQVMRATIHIGDALERLRELPDESAQCVVTSPPYWGLRDYGTAIWSGGDPECDHRNLHGVQGKSGDRADRTFTGSQNYYLDTCKKCGARRIDAQLGLEKTPEEYIGRMVEVFREVRRVLRGDATLWLNMGDSYAVQGGKKRDEEESKQNAARAAAKGYDVGGWSGSTEHIQRCTNTAVSGLKPKDLCGIPWMLAFALRADGWWLRQDIIWSKPNPMPESVTDRCTKAHEYLFLLTKGARYYFDQEAVAEEVAVATVSRLSQDVEAQEGSWRVPGKTNGPMKAVSKSGNKERKPASARGVPVDTNGSTDGAVAGSVPWEGATRNKRSVWEIATQPFAEAHFATFPEKLVEPCILAGSKPGDVVLDPFCGSGTVGVVALRYHRDFVGIELNPEYAEMAERRICSEIPLFAGVEVIRPKPAIAKVG